MSRSLALSARLRRLVVAVVTALGVAVPAILGLVQASPAGAALQRPSLDRSVCRWLPVPASIIGGDPTALYPLLGGFYSRAQGVAYKITGEFPHSTTLSFTAYNDYSFMDSPKNVLSDVDIKPDPRSLNPFQVGNPVNAPNRNYTVWAYPSSVRVPRGLTNVYRFPSVPRDPTDTRIRILLMGRTYQMQPGFSAVRSLPTVHAVLAADPSVRVPCPLTLRSTLRSILRTTVAWAKTWGPTPPVPHPAGDEIRFLRLPAKLAPFAEDFPSDGSVGYLVGHLNPSKVSVVTWHKTATFFNNQTLKPSAIMGDYQTRFMSLTVFNLPDPPSLSVNSDDAIYQPDGSWVTVFLPSQPRLTPSQIAAVRAKAALLGYNVIQEPVKNPIFPFPPDLLVRQKGPNPTFCCSVSKVPSWTDPNNPATANNNYRDWASQTSPEFFAKYSSSPANMGPYWIDGVGGTFEDFMQR